VDSLLSVTLTSRPVPTEAPTILLANRNRPVVQPIGPLAIRAGLWLIIRMVCSIGQRATWLGNRPACSNVHRLAGACHGTLAAAAPGPSAGRKVNVDNDHVCPRTYHTARNVPQDSGYLKLVNIDKTLVKSRFRSIRAQGILSNSLETERGQS
jgi:hypothetical protein